MTINKDTRIFCSFSKKAGNVGCLFFNNEFIKRDINAIYKSFSVESIKDAISAAKCLQFSGFAVSMPYKIEVLSYLDDYDTIVKKTGSCNTVIIKGSRLYGYNTDYLSIKHFLELYSIQIPFLYILGDGGYSKTLQTCCVDMNIPFKVIRRENWNEIETIDNSVIFNCTPVENISIKNTNKYIDCIVTSETGSLLAKKQAELQLELYIKSIL
jgi:shikimate 5-dehydrogenase